MRATLRRATVEDTAAIAALLADSYEDNPKAGTDVLRWQYWDNPFGQARSWVAEIDGTVVSHWAAVPVPLRVEGRAVRAAKGVDIATHPAHRGRGLFAEVAGALLADLGVEVLLSHPNPASAAAVERAGAVLVGHAGAYVRAVDPAFVARRTRLPLPLARLGCRLAFPPGGEADEADEVGAPPEDLDALWREAGRDHPTGIVRDSAWWQWRYAQRPHGRYRYVAARRGGTLTGAAACTVQERFGGRVALACEVVASTEPAARGLTRALTDLARSERAGGLAAVALPGTAQARVLAAAGLRRLPRRLEPRPLRVMVAAPSGDARALAALPWSMSWGDLDHL